MMQDLAFSLQQLVRHCARDRFDKVQSQECHLAEQNCFFEGDFPAYASILVMGGNSFRIQFTIFYQASDLFEIAAQYVGMPLLEFSRERLEDYAQEYCNLVAGAINLHLEEQSIRARTGLPLSAKGFGPPGVHHISYEDFFELRTSQTTLLGKTLVYLFPDEPMPKYEFNGYIAVEQDIEDFFDFA